MSTSKSSAPPFHASAPSTSIFKPDIFAGKVLFCTGGASGICYAQTKAMMAHGCRAAIFGRRAELSKKSAAELEKATGSKCLGLSGDVRNHQSIVDAVQETIRQFGRIDFVIAGAAGNFLSPIEAASPNAFKTVIEIDLLGTFNTVKATLPELKKTHGSIIAVSAVLQQGATVLQAHAASAKAGVDTLIRHVALEYGPFGIRANTIAPGPIADTEGIDRLVPPEQKGKTVNKLPSQRMGTKDDIANSTVYLFSPAGAYVTGTQLVVDGGDSLIKLQNMIVDYPNVLLEGTTFARPAKSSKL